MTDTRQALTEKGFSGKAVDKILERAAELQNKAEQHEEGLSQGALEAGAEAVGIAREFVDQAIREIKAEEERVAAQRSAQRRTLKTAVLVTTVFLTLTLFFSQRALNDRWAVVEEKQAQLENVLQRRHDLIPNLLTIAKISAAHESELIISLADVYQKIAKTREFEQRQVLEQQLGEGVLKLMSALRADPRASSMTLFVRLSDEMAGAENRISVERKRYNEAVAAYNRTARSFPVFLVRPFLSYPRRVLLFQASEDARHPLRF